MAASIGAFSYLRNTSLIFVILISFRCIIKNIVTKFCLLGDGHGLFLNCLWSAFAGAVLFLWKVWIECLNNLV